MDSWVVNLSDGSTHTERWIEGEFSPWQRLMNYCKKNGCYVTNLRLTMGTRTVSCPSNAAGYWQAHGMPAVQGVECDEELHKWRGIGWVEDDQVNIIWGARDPQTHDVVFWRDARSAKNQGQIVWAKPSLVLPTTDEKGKLSPKNLKEYSNKII